jgi:hypothetical protein
MCFASQGRRSFLRFSFINFVSSFQRFSAAAAFFNNSHTLENEKFGAFASFIFALEEKFNLKALKGRKKEKERTRKNAKREVESAAL